MLWWFGYVKVGVTDRIAFALTPVLATKSKLCVLTRLFFKTFQNIPSIETMMTGFFVKTLLSDEHAVPPTQITKIIIKPSEVAVEITSTKAIAVCPRMRPFRFFSSFASPVLSLVF